MLGCRAAPHLTRTIHRPDLAPLTWPSLLSPSTTSPSPTFVQTNTMTNMYPDFSLLEDEALDAQMKSDLPADSEVSSYLLSIDKDPLLICSACFVGGRAHPGAPSGCRGSEMGEDVLFTRQRPPATSPHCAVALRPGLSEQLLPSARSFHPGTSAGGDAGV